MLVEPECIHTTQSGGQTQLELTVVRRAVRYLAISVGAHGQYVPWHSCWQLLLEHVNDKETLDARRLVARGALHIE